jgi:hypothetical protein
MPSTLNTRALMMRREAGDMVTATIEDKLLLPTPCGKMRAK